MPTYQYQCTECGEALEVVQKFTDDALTVCDACGGRLRKVYSPVGIVVKGSGFYRTDSRGTSGAGVNGAAKDGAAKDGPSPLTRASTRASISRPTLSRKDSTTASR